MEQSSNNLKAVGATDSELRVANYMILFGGRDLVNEFFTKNTQIESPYTKTGMMYMDFEHGHDQDEVGLDKNAILGYVDWKTAKIDENGIFVERVLNRQADYMQYIEKMIAAGLIGNSSQAIPGRTAKKSNGEIIEWPLMRDSLTATPMEPRMLDANILSAAKSLFAIFPNSKSLANLATNQLSIEEITDFKSAEKFLRDAGNLSRSEATALVARIKNLTQRDSAADEEAKHLIAALSRKTEMLKH